MNCSNRQHERFTAASLTVATLKLLLIVNSLKNAVGFSSSQVTSVPRPRFATNLPAALVSSPVRGFTQRQHDFGDTHEMNTRYIPTRSPFRIVESSSPSTVNPEISRSRRLDRVSFKEATKNIVVTPVYASTVLATSLFVRSAMKAALSIVPTSLRVFFQPLLILYYVPLYILRSMIGPTRQRARADHVAFVENLKRAEQEFSAEQHGYRVSPAYS